MLSFVNDYSEGAHEQVLRRLAETIGSSIPDMGPIHTAPGQRRRSGRACGCPEGDVFSWWAGPRPIRR